MSVVEKMASDRLLQKGVPMKIRTPLFFRLLGWKHFTLRVTSPTFGTLLRVSNYYLSTGLSIDKLEDITHEMALSLMIAHGKAISKAVACAWLNRKWADVLATRLLAWYLREHSTPAELCNAVLMITVLGGTADFTNTTRSVGLMTVTAPRLGQNLKES